MLKRFVLFVFLIFTCVNITCADTVNLTWKNGDTTYSQSTCTVGGDLIVPSTAPTKTGYNFVGWNIKKAKELEYVTFANESFTYIDTGILFDSDEIEYHVKMAMPNTYVKAFGAAESVSDNICNISNASGFIGLYGSYTDVVLRVGNTSKEIPNISRGSVNIYDFIIIRDKLATVTLNSDTDTTTSWNFSGTPVSNRTIYIGGINYGAFGNKNCFFSGNIYYFRIKKDGVLVRDFVPAKDPDGVVCMYDRVSQTFFYTPNGVLGAGPEVQ